MKLVLSIILFFFIFFKANAQTSDTTIKYIWKNEVTGGAATIEIYGIQQTDKLHCVFYLNNVDTVYNNTSDSLFNEFVNISTLHCPIIKISFYNLLDSISNNKNQLYQEEFSKFILPDVHKRYPQININNLIITGADYFATVALEAAIANSQKINKTALFFSSGKRMELLEKVNAADIKKLKGKLYLYIYHLAGENNSADSITTNLALNAVVVFYKFDDFGEPKSSSIFEEAYHWLLADGNNYIIRNND